MFPVVVLLAMVVSGGVPAMALAMAVVGALLEMVSSIVVVVAKTSLVSMAVFSVVLRVSDAPDCSGTIFVKMVTLDVFLPFDFDCFDCFIVDTVKVLEIMVTAVDFCLCCLWSPLMMWSGAC